MYHALKRLARGVIAGVAVGVSASSLEAGQNWVGGGGNYLWTNPNNWSPAGSPTSGPSADLFFTNYNGYYNSVNDYSGWVSWRTLTFSAGGYFSLTSNSGCSIDLYKKIENWSANTASLSFSDIAFQGNCEFDPWYGTLSINATHVYTNGYTLGVFANNSKWLEFGPGTNITGSGKLRIAEYSVVDLQGANSYTGNTEIDTGYLYLHGSISSSSTVYIGNGGSTYANRSAYLALFNFTQPVASHIVVNKSDTGTSVGFGQRGIYGLQGFIALSGGIEVNGKLRLGGNLNVTGNIVDGSDNSANVARDVQLESGYVRFAGVNTYSGITTIGTNGAATLECGSSTAIPSGTGKGEMVISSGVLDVHGFNVNINGLSGAGTVDNYSAAAATLTLGNSNATSFFGGPIRNNAGTLSVIKVGAGSMLLSGSNTFSGDLTVNQGTLAVASIPYGAGKGHVHVNTPGALLLVPGTVALNGLWGDGIIDILYSNPTSLVIGYGDQSGAFSGAIRNSTGTMSLKKLGSGTLTLSGNNSYTGTTRVDGGWLIIDGTHSPAGAYTAYPGGTLGGSGTIAATVNVLAGGTISPGSSIGTLRTGDLTISGTHLAEFNTDAGTADQIDVTGTVSLSGATLQFAFVSASYGSTPKTFTIIRNDGADAVSGAFSNFIVPDWVTYAISYTYNSDGGSVGNDVAITISEVPEPSAALGLILGVPAMLSRRRW